MNNEEKKLLEEQINTTRQWSSNLVQSLNRVSSELNKQNEIGAERNKILSGKLFTSVITAVAVAAASASFTYVLQSIS